MKKPFLAPAIWHIAWEEISSAEGIFSTDGQDGEIFPSIKIASLTSVPKPPAWAMMIVGFAGFGFAALRRRRRAAHVRAA
jgi:MYXO-CTERM domain-containing protein